MSYATGEVCDVFQTVSDPAYWSTDMSWQELPHVTFEKADDDAAQAVAATIDRLLPEPLGRETTKLVCTPIPVGERLPVPHRKRPEFLRLMVETCGISDAIGNREYIKSNIVNEHSFNVQNTRWRTYKPEDMVVVHENPEINPHALGPLSPQLTVVNRRVMYAIGSHRGNHLLGSSLLSGFSRTPAELFRPILVGQVYRLESEMLMVKNLRYLRVKVASADLIEVR